MAKEKEKITESDDAGSRVDKKSTKRFGNKRNFKSNRSKERADRFNDVNWYYKYPALSEAAGKVGFNHISGMGYPDALATDQVLNYGLDEASVLAVRYITSPGICKGDAAGYAMQIRQLYLAMKRKYRGLNTYEPGDLGITLFCIMEFYRYIAKLERIYGLCKYFSAKNRTIPFLLPILLHFKYADVVNHLADFRTGINKLITKAASLCLPVGIDALNRWFLLESNFFKDSEGQRAAYIYFDDQNYFYTYQPTAYSTGGAAVLTDVGKHWQTPGSAEYEELLRTGHDMLDILLQDSDITLQLGDVISYFTKPDGSTELLKLEWIPEDYMVIPTYNEEILLQVHNSNTLGQSAATVWPFSLMYDNTKFNAGSYGYFDLAMAPDANHPIAITQDTNGVCRFELAPGNRIISRTIDAVDIPVFDFGTTDRTLVRAKSGSTILDTWKDVPSDKDVMEMTRLKIGINEKCDIFDTSAGTYAHFLECVALGTEIVTSYYIYSIDPSTHMPSNGKSGEIYTMMTALNFNHWATTEVPLIAQTGRIDWHPYIIHYTAGSGNTAATKYTYDELFGDMDNSRGIDINTLALIHDAAVLSEFKIESVQAFDQSAKILD